VIEFRKVRKQFGAVVAVDDVSFTISRPMMVGVIGRSGAGKSTLLRILNHLTPATSGHIFVEGRDVLALRGKALRRWQRECAMIFQQFNLVPRLDVITNVMLGRLNGHGTLKSMFNLFGERDISDGLNALDRLGIADQAIKRAEALSGGQQQRVAIARALMQEPKLILADEPIASLDPLNAEIVMKALREIHERDGKTVICNLHTLDTARTYCDRVIGMRSGEIVFDGASDALTQSAVREIYGAGADLNEASTSTSLNIESKPARSAEPTSAAAE